MSNDFVTRAFNALSNEDFVEKPVDIEEFVHSSEYLDQPELSDIQYECIKASTQIYKLSTLISLYGQAEGGRRYERTCNEIILQLGKGSGKDFISEISCAYIVYLLLCLRDPSQYYGKPKNNPIDILNIAVNSVQAQNVFFKGFKGMIEGSPWFEGKYFTKQGSIEFDKNITVHSGHSEREAWEGYNVLAVFLDEISGFAFDKLKSQTDDDDDTDMRAKTADKVYDMYRASVTSRFSEVGKLVLLSWPRFKDDFIQQRYDAVVVSKNIIKKSHVLKLKPSLPDGIEGNEFLVQWDHEVITSYKYDKVFALKRATWEVNPIKHIEDYTKDFFENPGDAYGRVACMPSNLASGFFKNVEAVRETFCKTNGVDHTGVFHPDFRPKEGTKYYIHVDLAQKHDRCAVAMAHVDKWVDVSIGAVGYHEVHPIVIVDCLRWWVPSKAKTVDFEDVRNFILALRRRGFNIGLTTFDRWNSFDTMKILKSKGIETDTLSVAKKHYDDFLTTCYEQRLIGPKEEDLIEELTQLRIIKDKIDHPRKGYKDLSDATCGAIFNAVAYTDKPQNRVVEAHTFEHIKRKDQDERRQDLENSGVIHAPPNTRMPKELEDYLDRLQIL